LFDSGAFQTLAEFAIALAGFSGVVVVFRRREGRLHPADHIRIFNALVPSLAAAFLALLPVGLDLLGLTLTASLIVSSIVHAGVVALISLAIEMRIRGLPPDARALLSRPLTLAFYFLLALSVAMNVLNAVSVLGQPRSGVYFFALLVLLAIAATVFARMVFIRPAA